jgi:hypothetical protein
VAAQAFGHAQLEPEDENKDSRGDKAANGLGNQAAKEALYNPRSPSARPMDRKLKMLPSNLISVDSSSSLWCKAK